MVRLMLTLTPIACVLSGVSVSAVLDTCLLESPPAVLSATAAAAKKETASTKYLDFDIRMAMVIPLALVLCIFPLHCTMVTSSAYSSPSVVLSSRRYDGR